MLKITSKSSSYRGLSLIGGTAAHHVFMFRLQTSTSAAINPIHLSIQPLQEASGLHPDWALRDSVMNDGEAVR